VSDSDTGAEPGVGAGSDGNYGVARPSEPPAIGGPSRGPQTGPAMLTREDAGELAIVHHFACQRRTPLRSALVPGAINYLCDDCGARVSIGPDGQPVGPEATAVATPQPRQSGRPGPGPLPGSSRAELEAIRSQLDSLGKPCGYGSIARAAGVSVATVRRRLAGN
jgi:hypothetical protein